jgi:tRNA pseudouridine38-40 synthase
MRTLKLTVAYDGTDYVGWQWQANGVSVQQRLEEAFAPLAEGLAHPPPTVVGASRTDAGVHAIGQVASVTFDADVPPDAVQRALNVRLPADIRVLDAVDAKPGFHARCHAVAKVYRYRIATSRVLVPFDRAFVWHAPEPRDVDAMQRAARALVGRHDFRSFQAGGSTVRHTVRTLRRLEVSCAGAEIVVDIEGDGFLRHMVRTLVGTLAEVGSGLRTPESMADILARRDRSAAGLTAPAAGLTLVSVRY